MMKKEEDKKLAETNVSDNERKMTNAFVKMPKKKIYKRCFWEIK